MTMASRDREGSLHCVFSDDGRVVDDTVGWGIKMVMIWRIQADMSNQRYDLQDWV